LKLNISSANLNAAFALFLIAAAFYVNFFVLNQGISHDIPFIQRSSDANQHTCFAEGLEKTRDFRYRPDYMAAGIKDSLHYSPSMLYILTLLLSQLSGMPVDDAIFLIVALAFTLPAVPIYCIVRRYFNEKIAIAAIVLALFPLNPFWTYAIGIGFWVFVLGALFIPFILYSLFCLIETKEPRYAAALGILIAAQFFAHPPVSFVMIPFVGLYSLYSLFKQRDAKLFKLLALSALMSAVLSLWYLLDFYIGYVKGPSYNSYGITWFKPAEAFGFMAPTLSFIHPLLLALAGAGILSLLFLSRKDIKSPPVAWIAFFMLFTFSNMIGVFYWPIRFRLLWMFYLSILAAYGLFMALRVLKLEKLLPAALILLLVYGAYTQASYNSQGGPLLTQKEHEAIKWIKANTSDNERFMVLFGFWQNSMCYSQRATFEVQYPYMIEKAKAGEIPTEFPGAYIFQLNDLPKKRGFLDYYYYKNDTYPSPFESACNVNYVIGNYNVTGNALEQYNVYIINKLLKEGKFEIAYENGGVAIIRNKEVTAKC
jgi:Dolichyl-phosphate-mannose-protein mannosyltransferase